MLGFLYLVTLEEGGYKKKGKSEDETDAIIEGCLALQKAGCFAVVLESVVGTMVRASICDLKS